MLLTAVAITCIISLITVVFYTVYATALAKVPGPFFWAASRIPWIYHVLRGTLAHRILELHLQYGEVVRIAPNEVSFTSADAWKAIYAYRPDHGGAYPKNPVWHATKPGFRTNNISTASTQDHTRIRKALSRAFAPHMMPAQELVMKQCVSKFANALQERAALDEPVNIVDWMHFFSFDMVSELGFGTAIFQCIDNGGYHPALEAMMTSHPHMNAICMRMVPYLEPTVNGIKSFVAKFEKSKPKSAGMMVEIGGAINRRLAEEHVRKGNPDLMSALIQARDEDKISEGEMKATAAIVQGGGGGTTGSGLSAAVNHLVRYPATLERLTADIRQRFTHADDMTNDTLAKLPYLTCVLQETLRLCPPTAVGVPRMVPAEGDFVSGYQVPPFPERWLPEARQPGSPFLRDNGDAMHVFSLGPRRCIGERIAWAEMRIALATLVWYFDITTPPGPVPKWEDQKTYPSWQKKDFHVTLRRRVQ